MSSTTVPRLVRGPLMFVCLLAAALALPAGALADGGASMALGPVKVHGGWSLVITASGCGTRFPNASLDFTKGSTKAEISHLYTGTKPSCRLSKRLDAGSVAFDWPGLARVKVHFAHANHPTRGTVPPECRGTGGVMRHLVATGTVQIAVRPAAFGRTRLRRITGTTLGPGRFRCRNGNSHGLSLTAMFGTGGAGAPPSYLVNAFAPAKGPRSVSIDVPGSAAPSHGVTASTFVSLTGGRSLFSAAGDLSRATIRGIGPLVTGSLAFTAAPACPGAPDTRNGSLSGQLVVHDPLGRFVLSGAQASSTFIVKGNGSPSFC